MSFLHKISYIMNLVLWNNYTLVLVWIEPASSSNFNGTITLLCSWILMEQLHKHQPSPWSKCGETWDTGNYHDWFLSCTHILSILWELWNFHLIYYSLSIIFYVKPFCMTSIILPYLFSRDQIRNQQVPCNKKRWRVPL